MSCDWIIKALLPEVMLQEAGVGLICRPVRLVSIQSEGKSVLAGQVRGGETKVVTVQQETLAMAVDATDWVRKSSFASFCTMYFILICVTFFV